jgi:hypothetical protein
VSGDRRIDDVRLSDSSPASFAMPVASVAPT